MQHRDGTRQDNGTGAGGTVTGFQQQERRTPWIDGRDNATAQGWLTCRPEWEGEGQGWVRWETGPQ